MSTITESSQWDSTVNLIDTSDLVLGGPGGPLNLGAENLANRTKKIRDILAQYGIFIDPLEEEFVGQPFIVDADFEATVVNGDVVYYNSTSTKYEKALGDGTAKEKAIGIANVDRAVVMMTGLFQTALSLSPGDPIFLSSTIPGTMTDVDNGIYVAKYVHDGVIYLLMNDLHGAGSIPVGSITDDKLVEDYALQSEIDTRSPNWDTAYSERHRWDGGATSLVPATGRASLELDTNYAPLVGYNSHIGANSAHGVTGNILGDNDTQTISNKIYQMSVTAYVEDFLYIKGASDGGILIQNDASPTDKKALLIEQRDSGDVGFALKETLAGASVADFMRVSRTVADYKPKTVWFENSAVRFGCGNDTFTGPVSIATTSGFDILNFNREISGVRDFRGFAFDNYDGFGNRSIFVDVGTDTNHSGSMFFQVHSAANRADFKFVDNIKNIINMLSGRSTTDNYLAVADIKTGIGHAIDSALLGKLHLKTTSGVDFYMENSSNQAQLTIHAAGAVAEGKNWFIRNTNGAFVVYSVNDAGTFGESAFTITKNTSNYTIDEFVINNGDLRVEDFIVAPKISGKLDLSGGYISGGTIQDNTNISVCTINSCIFSGTQSGVLLMSGLIHQKSSVDQKLVLQRTGAPADTDAYDFAIASDGAFYFRTTNSLLAGVSNIYHFTRSGGSITGFVADQTFDWNFLGGLIKTSGNIETTGSGEIIRQGSKLLPDRVDKMDTIGNIITASPSLMDTMDLGSVTAGDTGIFSFQASIAKGATSGRITIYADKYSGTGSLRWAGLNSFTMADTRYVEGNTTYLFTITATFEIQTSGTLVIQTRSDSQGSDSTVAANASSMSIDWLRKA